MTGALMLAFILALASPSGTPAGATPAKDSTLLLRVLSAERNLQSRLVAGKLVIGVLYSQKLPDSVAARDRLLSALQQSHPDWRGAAVESTAIEVSSLALLDARKLPSVFYVCRLPDDKDLAAIFRLTRGRRILTFTGTRRYVERGISVGLFPERSSNRIVINASAAREEGADFSSKLRKLATFIDGGTE